MLKQEAPDAQPLRLVLQKQPHVTLFTFACRSLTVTCRAPDALKFAPDASSAHRSYTQRGLQTRGVTGSTPPNVLLSIRSLTQRALQNA